MKINLDILMRRFHANEQGNVFILFALGVVFLVAIAGAGVDLGRQQLESTKLQASADAASISGAGISANLDNHGIALSNQQVLDAARRYFMLNYMSDGTTSGDALNDLNVQLSGSGDNTNLEVSLGNKTITTSFVGVIGHPTLGVEGKSTTNAIKRAETQVYEVLLLVDNSVSMTCSHNLDCWHTEGVTRIQAAKSASTTFIKSIMTPENALLLPENRSRMGAVAWSSYLRGSTPTIADDVKVVTDFINNMVPDGNTNSAIGFNKAIEMFNVTPARPTVQRAVVLLTDGNNIMYNFSTGEEIPSAVLNPQSIEACKTLKSMRPVPVIVYTIAFGTEVYQRKDVEDFLTNCATPENKITGTQYFFKAANQAELEKVFVTIGTNLKKIRVVK